VLQKGNSLGDSVDSVNDLPEEQRKYIDEQYKAFMEKRTKEKKAEEQKNKPPPPPEGRTPSKLGLTRNPKSSVTLTPMVRVSENSSDKYFMYIFSGPSCWWNFLVW
jgi:hypothetical protein